MPATDGAGTRRLQAERHRSRSGCARCRRLSPLQAECRRLRGHGTGGAAPRGRFSASGRSCTCGTPPRGKASPVVQTAHRPAHTAMASPREEPHSRAVHDADDIILEIAARQHGIVARWHLLRAGVPAHTIDGRVKRGRLQRLHRCVYRVSALAGARQREVAAVLACGEHAAASHRTAAAVVGIALAGDELAVSVARGCPEPRPGVRIHRVRLPAEERTVSDGVPVTVPARTLLDVSAVSTSRELEQAVAQALRLELVSERELVRILGRYPHRPGAPQLRALLARDAAPAFTRSEAEARFLTLVRRAELPPPATNVRVCGYEVDFYWRVGNLVVEIDGLAYHSSRAAIARDRRRDASLLAAGHRVMRVTWADIVERPEATAVRVGQALLRGAR
jgi:very-short-patch-repair endonuclease